MAAEALPKDGTRSFLLTTVVMKLLPDSAKSHVMQAAAHQPFKLSVHYTSIGNMTETYVLVMGYDSLVM